MWVVSLVLGVVLGLVGLAGLVTGADTGLTMIVGAGLWLKMAAIDKQLGN